MLKIKHKKAFIYFIITFLVIILISVGVFFYLISPICSSCVNQFQIKSGQSVNDITRNLVEQKIIRSDLLYKLYLKKVKKDNLLKPGNYQVKGDLNYRQLTDLLTTDQTNTLNITFYPGATLNFYNSKTDKTPYHRLQLEKFGFDKQSIDRVFNNHRDHKIFKLLPKIDNIEGLIYGETFNVFSESSIESVLDKNFDHFYQIIQQNDLTQKYQKQGLSLYQGIILASIIEREVNNNNDKPIVAQIFLSRLKQDMNLGSDVTYQYASRLAGKPNDLYIDSPYNTRLKPGLPPTPIASPSRASLLAIAKPSQTDYLFFLSGDDDKTYFAKTDAEHQQNIVDHCQIKCASY